MTIDQDKLNAIDRSSENLAKNIKEARDLIGGFRNWFICEAPNRLEKIGDVLTDADAWARSIVQQIEELQ